MADPMSDENLIEGEELAKYMETGECPNCGNPEMTMRRAGDESNHRFSKEDGRFTVAIVECPSCKVSLREIGSVTYLEYMS